MADHKYATWTDVPKTKQNLYAVLFSYLYVEHDGHIYEYEIRPGCRRGL